MLMVAQRNAATPKFGRAEPNVFVVEQMGWTRVRVKIGIRERNRKQASDAWVSSEADWWGFLLMEGQPQLG